MTFIILIIASIAPHHTDDQQEDVWQTCVCENPYLNYCRCDLVFEDGFIMTSDDVAMSIYMYTSVVTPTIHVSLVDDDSCVDSTTTSDCSDDDTGLSSYQLLSYSLDSFLISSFNRVYVRMDIAVVNEQEVQGSLVCNGGDGFDDETMMAIIHVNVHGTLSQQKKKEELAAAGEEGGELKTRGRPSSAKQLSLSSLSLSSSSSPTGYYLPAHRRTHHHHHDSTRRLTSSNINKDACSAAINAFNIDYESLDCSTDPRRALYYCTEGCFNLVDSFMTDSPQCASSLQNDEFNTMTEVCQGELSKKEKEKERESEISSTN